MMYNETNMITEEQKNEDSPQCEIIVFQDQTDPEVMLIKKRIKVVITESGKGILK